MNKLIISVIAGGALLLSAAPALATQIPQVDKCGDTFNYTKSSDYNDSRININYQDNDNAVTVTTGYKIVKVEADVEGDTHSNYYDYTSQVQNGVKWNPNPGSDIESLKITIEKTCKPVCPDETALNYEAEVEGQTYSDKETCEYPVDVCPNIEGVQEELPKDKILEEGQCIDVPGEPVATPSATPQPPVLPLTGAEVFLLGGLGVLGSAFGISLYQTRRFFKREEKN